MILLESLISQDPIVTDDKEIECAKKRFDEVMEKYRQNQTQISPLCLNPRKRSQFSLKFIRWSGAI